MFFLHPKTQKKIQKNYLRDALTKRNATKRAQHFAIIRKNNRNVENFTTYVVNNCYKFRTAGNYHNN